MSLDLYQWYSSPLSLENTDQSSSMEEKLKGNGFTKKKSKHNLANRALNRKDEKNKKAKRQEQEQIYYLN